MNPLGIWWTLLCVAFTAFGTGLITGAVPPEIPQASKAFTPPSQAIAFIAHNPPRGNQLNDPHFGDVMLWQMENNPPVFIDSRYNLFGNDLLQDYWKMVECRPGWSQLLDKYRIDWIFLPPQLALPKTLANDPSWHLLYSNRDSVVYARNQQLLPQALPEKSEGR